MRNLNNENLKEVLGGISNQELQNIFEKMTIQGKDNHYESQIYKKGTREYDFLNDNLPNDFLVQWCKSSGESNKQDPNQWILKIDYETKDSHSSLITGIFFTITHKSTLK